MRSTIALLAALSMSWAKRANAERGCAACDVEHDLLLLLAAARVRSLRIVRRKDWGTPALRTMRSSLANHALQKHEHETLLAETKQTLSVSSVKATLRWRGQRDKKGRLRSAVALRPMALLPPTPPPPPPHPLDVHLKASLASSKQVTCIASSRCKVARLAHVIHLQTRKSRNVMQTTAAPSTNEANV